VPTGFGGQGLRRAQSCRGPPYVTSYRPRTRPRARPRSFWASQYRGRGRVWRRAQFKFTFLGL